MKKILFLLLCLMLFIAACTANQNIEGRVNCEEPRPEVCVAVYDPVCGDNGETYSNACAACGDAGVSYSDAGECT